MLDKQKRKRRKNLACHFGEDDMLIDGFRLNAVHYIDGKYEKTAEYDFYMDTGDDMYLLRLQNIPENVIIFVNRESVTTKIIPVTYIIVRKSLKEDIFKELTMVIKKLKSNGFKTAYDETVIEIDSWE